MGSFICRVSDKDWPRSRDKGVYGNRENRPDGSAPLRLQDRLSVIRDLVSIRPRDLIFFHVVGKEFGPSALCGPYQARSMPYYDRSPIWDNALESFPFRVLFEPLSGYEALCSDNFSITISALYATIESRKIWSLATLENEDNIEKRAVRKISQEDARTILNLFWRKLPARLPTALWETAHMLQPTSSFAPMRNQIKEVGRYENAIKALLMHKLADRDDSCLSIFPNYVDFVNETFVAPITRKLMDILVVSRSKGDARHYYIMEAKTATFKFADLKQLLQYTDLFRQRPVFNRQTDKVSACALAVNFDDDTVRFRDLHAHFCPYDQVMLVTYEPNSSGTDARLAQLTAGALRRVPIRKEAIGVHRWGSDSPRSDIVQKASAMLPFYTDSRLMTRSLKEKVGDNGFVIEEKSAEDGSLIKIYFVFVLDGVLSRAAFNTFFEALYSRVACLVDYDFRVIAPVIICRHFEEVSLEYISIWQDLSVRRPIALYQY
jgi:hypothetical protein